MILPLIKASPTGRWISQSHIVGSPVIIEESDYNAAQCAGNARPKTSDFTVTSPKFAELVKAIQKTINESPKWLRSFWGKSTFTHRVLYQIIISAIRNDLTIATDGSINFRQAAHAFCFATINKGHVLFSTGSKVPEPYRFMTSYRAEMISILSAISLIDIILRIAGIQKQPITLHIDSEPSITTSTIPRLHTLHYVLSNDIDVALELQWVCKTNKQIITLSHVHGHQNKDAVFRGLSLPSQLNILMDRLSKKLVDETFHFTNRIIPLPSQRLYLAKTEPIVHDVLNVLILGEMDKDFHSYSDKHHGIGRKQVDKVDWEALEQGTKSQHEISYRKTLHNLNNTMTINKKWGRIKSYLYPLCTEAPETTIHLMSCTQADVMTVRNQMIARFKDTMNRLNTAPAITEHWMKILRQYDDGQPLEKHPITMNPTTWNIAQAHMTQADIGWDCFFHGMLAKEWSKIQQQHYDQTEKREKIFTGGEESQCNPLWILYVNYGRCDVVISRPSRS